MNELFFSKAYGCLAGVAIGDAMGMPVADLTPTEIRKRFVVIKEFLEAPPDHPYHSGFKPGQVTDDTEMTLIVVQMILEDGKVTPNGIAKRLMRWANSKDIFETNLIGPSTARALRELMAGRDPAETGRYGTTNGAAMKISPIGIINVGNVKGVVDDVEKICLPTHGTSVAISAASAIASAIAEALTSSPTVSSVLKAAKLGAELGEKRGRQVTFPSVKKRIELAIDLIKGQTPSEAAETLYDYIGADVSCSDSIPTALGLFVASKGDPMTTIFSAVNMGGDTDTIASIAGAIAGAFKGINTIPQHFIKQVEKANGLDLLRVARRLTEFVEEHQ